MVSFGKQSSSQQSSSNGFNELPQQLKGAFMGLGTGIQDFLNSGKNEFAPLAQTADETQGYSMLRQGFAPTQQSFASDMAMLNNPYNESVISRINREANGDFSLLKQAQNAAGQIGSNRSILGANDIDLTRTNQIGGFLSDQWNTNQNAVLNQLPALRQQDATNLLGIGSSMRSLASQQNQASINKLLAAAQALGVLPKTEGSSQSTGKSSGFNGSFLGG